MAKSKKSVNAWDEIIESLILETEPPIRYIKDAIVVTKSGVSYKLSASDFAELVEKEKSLSPEQSEIHHCSLSIDFNRIKRDVNKWTNDFIIDLEKEIAETNKLIKIKAQKKKASTKKPIKKKTTVSDKKFKDTTRRKSN